MEPTTAHFKAPPPKRKPTAAILAAFCIAAIVGVYGGYWAFAATRAGDVIRSWAEARQAEGLETTFAAMTTGGFPAWIRIDLASVVVARAVGPRPWSWTTEKLSLRSRPWDFEHVLFDASGIHRLSLGDASSPRVYELTAGQLTGTVARYCGSEVFLEVSVNSAGLELSDGVDSPLGHTVAQAELGLRVLRPVLPGPLADALAIWRDAGGTLEVDRLTLAYGPLTLEASGTVALDTGLQPQAAFSARAEGVFEAVEALRARRVIEIGDALAARLALTALSKTPEGGGAAYLQVPLSIQERTVYAGSVALIRLPRVRWR